MHAPLDRCKSVQERTAYDKFRKRSKAHRLANATIEIRGNHVQVKIPTTCPKQTRTWKREAITEFSRRSRFRMLCVAASVDWSQVPGADFITLTYPDEKVHWCPYERNKERQRFQRWIEKVHGVQVPTLWRVEWLPRKSGCFRGRVSPHLHLLVLRRSGAQRQEVMRAWGEAIGWTEFVSCKIIPLREGSKAAVYIGKYCGKVEPSERLDNLSYLTATGRHWGVVHKPLIPLAEVMEPQRLTAEQVLRLRQIAANLLPWFDTALHDGFTLIGKNAERIQRCQVVYEVRENALMALDEYGEIV